MSIETFLLFIAFGLFSLFNAFMNLKTGSNVVKKQSYFLTGLGLCGMLYLLIVSLGR